MLLQISIVLQLATTIGTLQNKSENGVKVKIEQNVKNPAQQQGHN